MWSGCLPDGSIQNLHSGGTICSQMEAPAFSLLMKTPCCPENQKRPWTAAQGFRSLQDSENIFWTVTRRLRRNVSALCSSRSSHQRLQSDGYWKRHKKTGLINRNIENYRKMCGAGEYISSGPILDVWAPFEGSVQSQVQLDHTFTKTKNLLVFFVHSQPELLGNTNLVNPEWKQVSFPGGQD